MFGEVPMEELAELVRDAVRDLLGSHDTEAGVSDLPAGS